MAGAHIPIPERIKNGRFDAVDRVDGVIAADVAGIVIVNESVAWFALVSRKKPTLRNLTPLAVNKHSGLTGYVQPRVAFTSEHFLVATQRAEDLLVSTFDREGKAVGQTKRIEGSSYVHVDLVASHDAFFALVGTPGDFGPHNLQILEFSAEGDLRGRHRLTKQPQGTTSGQRDYRVTSSLMLREGVVWVRAATSLGSVKERDPYDVVLWWDGKDTGETRCG